MVKDTAHEKLGAFMAIVTAEQDLHKTCKDSLQRRFTENTLEWADRPTGHGPSSFAPQWLQPRHLIPFNFNVDPVEWAFAFAVSMNVPERVWTKPNGQRMLP